MLGWILGIETGDLSVDRGSPDLVAIQSFADVQNPFDVEGFLGFLGDDSRIKYNKWEILNFLGMVYSLLLDGIQPNFIFQQIAISIIDDQKILVDPNEIGEWDWQS
jgi:hypothetical protein